MKPEHVKYDVVRYTRGTGFHVRCGAEKAFPHMLGVEQRGEVERMDVLVDRYAALSEAAKAGSAAFVYCQDVTAIDDWGDALTDWFDCLAAGGHLCVVVPTLSVGAALEALGESSWNLIVRDQRDECVLLVLRKLAEDEHAFPIEHRYDCDDAQPAKRICIVRHGGFGDQLQAAFLLPQLKREGWHITLLTTPKGRSVLEHDPNVDEWFMVDEDQVPNPELGPFWRATARHYDRFVNLNESVEGTFLAMPGRIAHTWPHALRHEMLNKNYAEFAAKLAQIPFVPEGRFYPSEAEDREALDRIYAIAGEVSTDAQAPAAFTRAKPLDWPYFVMFSLSGSSPHKFTPHQDVVLGMILAKLKRAVVLLVGDAACKILEAGLEEVPRLHCLSGELTIRQTLALARRMDLVMGPETGVLNSVAYEEKIAKVVLLSHSSTENLTKHWVNTVAVPGIAPCWPCHMLHFTSDFCPRDPDTHAAMCQKNVSPASIYFAVDAAYTGWVRAQMLRAA